MKETVRLDSRGGYWLYLIFAFLAVYAIRIHYSLLTSNLLLVPIFASLTYFYKKQNLLMIFREDMRQLFFMGILAIVFSIFQVFGAYETYYHHRSLVSISRILLSLLAWAFLFWNLSVFLYHWLDSVQIRQSFNKQHRLKYFGLVGILFILWLPYLLNYFPGTTTWDTEYQLTQVIGARPINAAHPILHTLFIKAIYSSSLLFFGNANIALAMVTVAQMLLLSLIYAYVIYYLYHNNYPKVIWLGSVFFYGVFALNATHTVVLWKDILFSAVFLLFSLFLSRAKDVNFNDRRDAARYFLKLALPAVLVCLMRNNGIYIFLGLIPFMLYFFRIRLMHILIMITLTLITQYGVERILHNRFDVIPSYANDKVELLSIPIQQISRVVVEDGHVDQESKALLEKLMSSEDIKSNYNPVLSDPMKQLIRSSENVEFFERSISDYGKLWLSLGLANPHLYMKAYIDQTRGYWYPDIQGPVIRMESAGKEDSIDTYQVNLLGDSFSNFMNRVNFIYLDIPILGIFYSLATYIWFVLFVLAVLFIRRMNFLATLPAIILWGILLVSTPVSGEFRYAYPIVISAPLYMAMLVDSFKVKAIYDRQKNSAD